MIPENLVHDTILQFCNFSFLSAVSFCFFVHSLTVWKTVRYHGDLIVDYFRNLDGPEQYHLSFNTWVLEENYYNCH